MGCSSGRSTIGSARACCSPAARPSAYPTGLPSSAPTQRAATRFPASSSPARPHRVPCLATPTSSAVRDSSRTCSIAGSSTGSLGRPSPPTTGSWPMWTPCSPSVSPDDWPLRTWIPRCGCCRSSTTRSTRWSCWAPKGPTSCSIRAPSTARSARQWRFSAMGCHAARPSVTATSPSTSTPMSTTRTATSTRSSAAWSCWWSCCVPPPGDGGGMLADQTTIVVASEMARTPWRNVKNGRDHWPYTSLLLIGAGIRGGQQVGGYNDLMDGVATDLRSGAPSPSGVVITPSNLGATLLTLAGIEPELWCAWIRPAPRRPSVATATATTRQTPPASRCRGRHRVQRHVRPGP